MDARGYSRDKADHCANGEGGWIMDHGSWITETVSDALVFPLPSTKRGSRWHLSSTRDANLSLGVVVVALSGSRNVSADTVQRRSDGGKAEIRPPTQSINVDS
ncbi:uncharacterized protein LDX57_006077 [Aspergillus melleus]|uniref:uncharacterized protein n=1 Tax=Aspergillus melleus TaxID=138277 RepID=UPI001E8D493E|nr:uncharacterized protein LDX57_006077 [Aspergillus melleus]KAH8428379.1 hypothetical protein LDX57_006077 [Aspergillus melleus]